MVLERGQLQEIIDLPSQLAGVDGASRERIVGIMSTTSMALTLPEACIACAFSTDDFMIALTFYSPTDH